MSNELATATPTATIVSDATKDASVLNGVGTSPARPGRPAPKKAPAKAPAKNSPAPAPSGPATGAARYRTGYVPPRAMVGFTRWIGREYPDLFPGGYAKLSTAERARYERLVSVASKAYGYFQKSDLNR